MRFLLTLLLLGNHPLGFADFRRIYARCICKHFVAKQPALENIHSIYIRGRCVVFVLVLSDMGDYDVTEFEHIRMYTRRSAAVGDGGGRSWRLLLL
ncbi:hypothetical protein NDU88_008973 [Pleurodeles waltl]|uniref:Secreted protein n=1 Tax=Pleurodeles waltl TaxID=8319 RepID=A0AAV7PTP4_PLEWA|nr:hypothetical protein NDU88_008973 [Pleurodeles waltl]